VSARAGVFAFFLAAPAALAFACSTPPTDARFVETAPDGGPTFVPVADMLVHTCGTLDCHGTQFRNLRLYGREGVRWDKDASPTVNDAGLGTTATEYEQDYLSVVGLEPEVMSQVVSQGGAAPERLTLVRKGRGTEAHKGGSLYKIGDDRDVCLLSWLAGKTDTTACARSVDTTIYP
jgi:hypothetical protein